MNKWNNPGPKKWTELAFGQHQPSYAGVYPWYYMLECSEMDCWGGAPHILERHLWSNLWPWDILEFVGECSTDWARSRHSGLVTPEKRKKKFKSVYGCPYKLSHCWRWHASVMHSMSISLVTHTLITTLIKSLSAAEALMSITPPQPYTQRPSV